MTAMRPEDVAAMFDLPPLPEASSPAIDAAAALAAEEAALAAEFAADGAAADMPDSRTNLRADVSWPARLQLPDGRVIDLWVRNISAAGAGLASDRHIPADTRAEFEMRVPPLDGGGSVVLVKGTIRTTYTVVQGAQTLCGGTWVQAPAEGLDLVDAWIARLRR